VIHVTHEIQIELYQLLVDRGAEERRVQTYKRSLGDIPTAPDIHNQNAGFFMVGFMTSCTTLWPSPQTPPL
jgi:hypothetical protein